MLPTSTSRSDEGFLALFKNRPFLTLWCGQIFSQVADKVFFVLLIALLVDYQTPGSPINSMRSMLMITVTLPAVLLGSLAGVYVDRHSKRPILSGGNFLRGLLVLSIPLLPKVFSILLLIAFLESILTQFFAPAEQAAIPLLVSRQGLMSANALFTATMMGSLIIGFAIGEPLLSTAATWFGKYGREIIVGAGYLLAALILYLVPIQENRAHATEQPANAWEDFKIGLDYLRQNRLVSNAVVQLAILYSVLASLMVLAFNLAEQIGLKSTQFGFLLAAVGIGIVLGSAFLGHFGNRLPRQSLSLGGFSVIAIVLALFAWVKDLSLGLSLSGCLGLGAAMIGIPMQTLIQQQTPEAVRGKVFGFQNNVVNIALNVPLVLTGLLTDRLGLQSVVLLISGLVAAAGIWCWQYTRHVLPQD